jgi:hypothetical protein|nr:DUF6017 domain-containing protein [uncultured Acetatifactor sp.]
MQRIQFDYFHGIEAEQYNFYRVPKVLFTADYFKALTCEAKVLYGLMLDRMSLSVRNRWFDEEDRVYIIFTIEEIMELLCCRTQKAVKLLKELDIENGIGLIEKRRPGLGRPNVIYVKNFMVEEADDLGEALLQPECVCQDSSPEDMQEAAAGGQEAIGLQEEITISETAGFQNEKGSLEAAAVDKDTGNQKSRILKIKNQNFPRLKNNGFENQKSGISAGRTPQFPESKSQGFENQNSVLLKTESQELPKSKPNNTDFNDTESSETEPIHPNLIDPSDSFACPGNAVEEMNIYREIIRDRISYRHFTYDSRHLREEVDELVELVVDVMMMPDNSTLRIAGVERPVAVVKNRFMRLEQSHIEYVTGCLQKNTSKIENIKAYLLTTLYNATMTIDNYYRAEVNHDMYGRQSG